MIIYNLGCTSREHAVDGIEDCDGDGVNGKMEESTREECSHRTPQVRIQNGEREYGVLSTSSRRGTSPFCERVRHL